MASILKPKGKLQFNLGLLQITSVLQTAFPRVPDYVMNVSVRFHHSMKLAATSENKSVLFRI